MRFLGAKCAKNAYAAGPHWGSLQRSPRLPIVGFKGPTSKGRGGHGWGEEEREGEGKGKEGSGRGKGEGRKSIPVLLFPHFEP